MVAINGYGKLQRPIFMMTRLRIFTLFLLSGLCTSFSTWADTTPTPVYDLDSSNIAHTEVDGGYRYSCILTTGAGTVQCWGNNDNGQLGNGSNTNSSTPVMVSGLSNVTAIATGASHACALMPDTTVKCWGSNGSGRLGDGTTTSSNTPVTVLTAPSGPPLTGVTAIAAGFYHTCALISDGTMLCWGYNSDGELGNGTTTGSSAPVTVSGLSGLTVTAIAAGDYHTCALITNGTLQCWGYNSDGQLGNGTNNNSTTPVTVSGLSGVTAIAAGYAHTCALIAGGTIQCWGNNGAGQLGNGTNNNSTTPVTVSGLSGVTAIAAGDSHTCALIAGGAVKCWGENTYGQLGNDSTSDSNAPVTVSSLSGVATAIAAGSYHTCALMVGNNIECWGLNDKGQLGNGTTTNSASPVSISNFIAIAGSSHTCALRAEGSIHCWGSNVSGQLGNATNTDSATPVTVLTSSGGSALTGAIAIATGGSYTCALISGGTVKCWGNNGSGQLGDGTATQRNTPVTVLTSPNGPALTGVTAIATGNAHTCALISGGSVQCWGSNSSGQLGNSTTTSSTTPVTVTTTSGSALTGVTAIATGNLHTCALILGGSVQCWGLNGSGQLGDGTTTNRATPVTVLTAPSGPALTGVTAIAAGNFHTCTLILDGSMRCWGSNTGAQLGDTTTTNRTTPVTVLTAPSGPALTGVTAIAAGNAHTCALISGGSVNSTVQCWGSNNSGQLGDGTIATHKQPAVVLASPSSTTELKGVTTIAAGVEHTCALISGGTMRCWGSYNSGQLGNGSMSRQKTAVLSGLSILTSFGSNHACFVTSSNTVQCVGNNVSGQLGNSSTATSTTPVAVTSISSVNAIASGISHTCALISSGSVKCWGSNSSGQLGDGTTTQRNTPVTVLTTSNGPALTGVTAIAAGDYHTCALISGGSVQCWGSNSSGQLATTTTSSTTPVTVLTTSNGPALTGVNAIAAGSNHTCALISGGSMQCWGYNGSGQLGNGSFSTTTPVTTPVTVSGLSGTVTAIAVGSAHTCALISSGSVQCWGANSSGQLGIGGAASTSPVTTPVTVVTTSGPALAGVTAIAAGSNHTCALISSGSVQCWGANSSGQLGNNSISLSTTPVVVKTSPTTNLTSVNAITTSSSADQTCASHSDSGAVRCWGDSYFNELAPKATQVKLDKVPTAGLTYGDDLLFNVAVLNEAGLFVRTFNGTVTVKLTPTTTGTVVAAEHTFTSTDNGWYRAFVANIPAGTYTLTATSTGLTTASTSITVNPKSLSVSGIAANDKPYDGTTSATLNTSNATLSGVVSGDTVTLVTTNGSANFSDSLVAANKPVTVTGYTLSGSNAANYSLTQPTGLTATISQKPLKVSGIAANNKTYDGTTSATLNTSMASLQGLVSGDDVKLSVGSATTTFPSSNVGNYSLTIGGSFSLSGNDKDNYNLTQPANSLTAAITQKILTVSGITANDKTYDGTTKATLNTSNAVLDDVVTGDRGKVILDASAVSATFNDGNAGQSKAISTSGNFGLSGGSAANYSLTQPTLSLTATITKASLTVRADNKTMYVGDSLPAFTASYSGFLNSESTSALSGQPTLSTNATSSSPAGNYDITVAIGSLTATNYTFDAFVNGTLTVQQTDTAVISATQGASTPHYLTVGKTSSGSLSVTVSKSGLAQVGAVVTLIAPDSTTGASLESPTYTATTGSDGIAVFNLTANTIASASATDSYTVTASITGSSVSFNLTNVPDSTAGLCVNAGCTTSGTTTLDPNSETDLSVHLVDRYNNTAWNETSAISFSVPSGAKQLSTDDVTDQSKVTVNSVNGIATVAAHSTGLGTTESLIVWISSATALANPEDQIFGSPLDTPAILLPVSNSTSSD